MVCFVGVNLAKLVILSFHIAVANSGLCELFTVDGEFVSIVFV